jgi:hypothetical protein
LQNLIELKKLNSIGIKSAPKMETQYEIEKEILACRYFVLLNSFGLNFIFSG